MGIEESLRVRKGLSAMSQKIVQPFIADPDCRECGDKKHSLSNPGFYYVYEGRALKECSCHKKWKRDSEVKIKAQNANIWCNDSAMEYNPDKNYLGKTSWMEIEKLKLVVKDFDKYKGNTLYLYGINGTQKTTISQWVGLSLLRKGFSVHYMTMKALVDVLAPNFEDPEASKKKVEYLTNIDALILEEVFDKKKMVLYSSGFQIGFLTDFLKERIENGKFVMFISNTHPNDIKEAFGDSLHSLVYRNTIQMGTLLEFKDVYNVQKNVFSAVDIFSKDK